jgi:hypothetical protein
MEELTRDPAVVERVHRTVDAANAELASYARVKRFAVLPRTGVPRAASSRPRSR